VPEGWWRRLRRPPLPTTAGVAFPFFYLGQDSLDKPLLSETQAHGCRNIEPPMRIGGFFFHRRQLGMQPLFVIFIFSRSWVSPSFA
jgi:hypothetical protein